MLYAIGIDIGGTKTAVGIVGDDGEVTAHASIQNADYADGEQLLLAITELGEKLAVEVREYVVVVGVGTAGPMEPRGEFVSPLNLPVWRNFPLRKRLQEQFQLPTFVDNDCKALALGEAWKGAAKGKRNFIAMVVSTGVGGGIILDGRLLNGRRDNAGHIGHLIVAPDGRECACGARGCLEAQISGPSILAATGVPPEKASPETVEYVGTLLGRAVASTATLLDLNLALVGGSVALGFGAPMFAAAQAEIEKRARLPFSAVTAIKPVGLGPMGGIVGAARVGLLAIEAADSRA